MASSFPHHSSVVSSKPYIRTYPSYLKKCETLVESSKANIVYKKEVASMECEPHLVYPCKHPGTLRFKYLHNARISQDALFNLHEIAYDVPGFVWKIITYPDLVCICGLQEVLEDADKILMLQHDSQLLSYDTTFQLGDFMFRPSLSGTQYLKRLLVFQLCS